MKLRENFSKDFPCKFTPALVLHVLYFPLKLSLILLWSESESILGHLNFFNFRYVEGEVLGYNNIGIKKCTTIFLWVLNLGQVGEILENFQNHPLGESFWKIFSKVWFWKKLWKDFPGKNEDFFLERFSRKIKGDF